MLAQVRQFDIPPGDAGKSIPELARQAGVAIVGPGRVLHGVITPEVKGVFDVVDVLKLLLKGTDLNVSRSTEGVIMISSRNKNDVCNDEGEPMRNSVRLTTTVSGLAMFLAAMPPAAAQADNSQQVETVVVSGVRASLETAQAIKKDSTQIVDSIVADDISKLPDRSIADALSRITGVQIGNSYGEGSSVAIRGLTQIRTQLNGRDVFTAGSTNALSLEYVPAELLAGIDVYKNPSADFVEDQLSGTVNMRTRKPFDFDGFKLAGSVAANYYDLAQKVTPSATVLFSDRWKTNIGEIGGLATIVYQKTSFREEQVGTEPFYKLNETNPVDAATAATLGRTGQITTLPHGAGLYDLTGGRDRVGIDTVLQWRPNDNMEITAEYFHNDFRFDTEGVSYYAYTSDSPIYPLPGAKFTYADNGDFQSGTFQDVRIDVNEFRSLKTTSNDDITLNLQWTPTDKLTVTGDLQYSHSAYNTQYYMVGYGSVAPTLYQDLSKDNSTFLIGPGQTTMNAANYHNNNVQGQFTRTTGEDKVARLDAEYKFGNGFLKSVKTGFRFAERTNSGANSEWFYQTTSGPVTNYQVYDLDNFMRGDVDIIPGFVAFKKDTIRSFQDSLSTFGINHTLAYLPSGSNGIYLKTLAGYAAAFFDSEVLGIPIDGNVGVRVVDTKESANGYYEVSPQVMLPDGSQTLGKPVYQQISASTNYVKALPSLNLRAHLTDDLRWRFAMSQNVARPTFGQLNPSLSIHEPIASELNRDQYTSGGNPFLKPMTSFNIDTSLEWYFNDSSSVTVAAFYKYVKNYIQTGISDRQVTFPDNVSVLYHVTSYNNSQAGKIKGFEVGYQQFFDFLPGALRGLGAQANFTYVDSNAPSPATQGPVRMVPLEQLSRYSTNLILMYEMDSWSVRAAYNWRSPFVSTTSGSGTGKLPIFSKSYGQIDGSAQYTVNDHLAFTLDGRNLNGAQQHSYQGLRTRPRTSEMSDRRISLSARLTY